MRAVSAGAGLVILQAPRKFEAEPVKGNAQARFGDPANGVESIMVEINKKLFMDTKTFKKTAGFERIRADATKVLSAVIRYSLEKAQP